MSHVTLIAAGKKLPLCDCQEHTSGFQVFPHKYYRHAVDELGFEIKPFQYELDFQLCQDDVNHLLGYLRKNFSPGEEVELWSVWVGSGGGSRPRRYRGRLAGFDLDTLGMLRELPREPDLTGEYPNGLFSQVCLMVEV